MACERQRLMKARKRQRELIIFFSLLFSFQLLLFLCCQSGRWWYHHSGPLSGPDNEQRRKVMKRRKKRTHRIIEILPYIYIFFFSSFFPYRLWFRLKFPQNCDGNCFNLKKNDLPWRADGEQILWILIGKWWQFPFQIQIISFNPFWRWVNFLLFEISKISCLLWLAAVIFTGNAFR